MHCRIEKRNDLEIGVNLQSQLQLNTIYITMTQLRNYDNILCYILYYYFFTQINEV